MMRPFPLQAALDLAERQAEARLRRVKLAYADWLVARARVVRLQQRREAHGVELSRILGGACPAAVTQLAAQGLRRWQGHFDAATGAVRDARAGWQQALDAWQQESRRLEALRALALRHRGAEYRLEQQRERRLHDELSQRSALAARLQGKGAASLLFSECTESEESAGC